MEIRREITMRFGIIYFLIALVGLVIVVKIFMIQNVDTAHWSQIAKDLRSNTTEIFAKRGNICADDGTVLATSLPLYEIRMDLAASRIKEIFNTESNLLVNEVSDYLGISKPDLQSRLNAAFLKKNRWFLLVNDKLDITQLAGLKKLRCMSRSKFGSGLIVVAENNRILPHGDLASRTIGVLNKGAFGGVHGNVGYNGIEGLEENYLSGQNGLALKRNLSGIWVNMPLIDPVNGKDVITTLNVNLQDYAQTALMKQMITSDAEWGTAIVMEVATGNIKAIANLGRKKDGTYGETYNYAIGHQGCSEPGSTFKLVSLMVGLEHGYIDTTERFDTGVGKWEYKGQTVYDSDYGHGGHGVISVKKIFELSSNVGTAKVITKYYENRKEDFIDRIYNFGLNKPLGLGFLGEGTPQIKYPTDQNWWGPSLAWISFGYEIKVTPMQTLTFYNAIANNGKMVKPRFIDEVREDGILVRKFPVEVINPSICSRKTLTIAQELLKGVVEHGTGKALKSPYYKLAGKTGTAQIAYDNAGYSVGGQKRYQASFCGYFPADNPKYSCIVVIVGPKGKYYGGSVAGPVFREIADKVYATFLDPIPPRQDTIIPAPPVKPGLKDDILRETMELELQASSEIKDGTLAYAKSEGPKVTVSGMMNMPGMMPDVTGMGASDAVYALESAGMNVKIKGFGRVMSQSVPAGAPIQKDFPVVLELGVGELLGDSTRLLASVADSLVQGPVQLADQIKAAVKAVQPDEADEDDVAPELRNTPAQVAPAPKKNVTSDKKVTVPAKKAAPSTTQKKTTTTVKEPATTKKPVTTAKKPATATKVPAATAGKKTAAPTTKKPAAATAKKPDAANQTKTKNTKAQIKNNANAKKTTNGNTGQRK